MTTQEEKASPSLSQNLRTTQTPQGAGEKGSRFNISPEDHGRANVYRLLAGLLSAPPTQERLSALQQLQGDDSPFGQALQSLVDVAATCGVEAVEEEYHALFIGVARGELVPYGSYYLTGFLNEKPLANLRAAMRDLGIVKSPDNKDPEDHIGSVCDMMAGLILGEFSEPTNLARQKAFFNEHIGSWAPHLFKDLEGAKSAILYAPLGTMGRLFMDIEETAFGMS